MKVRDLMERIRLKEIALPEFQREFVWEVGQAQKLLQSLYNGYPTGSLLFWNTTTPPATKGAQETLQTSGQRQIILDGQQRLTTLYLLTQGVPPPYYGLNEIAHDPRGLHFDLVAGTFRLPQTGVPLSSALVSVAECFCGEPDTIAIARSITGMQQGEAVNQLITQCVNNLGRLRGLLDYDYPVQVVPVSATLDDAIDVFDRVNSLGTKLTSAELALTHISGKWSEARQTMKALLQGLADKHFHLDLDLLVRGLAGVVSGSNDLRELHYLPASVIQEGWERLASSLTELVTSLLPAAFVNSDAYLSAKELLLPLVVSLASNGGVFPNNQVRRRAIYWLYVANMWGRYTGEVEQRLAHDLSIVRRSEDPWIELVGTIVEQRGRVELRPSDLEGRSIEHPLSHMVMITLAARGAVDWTTGVALSTVPRMRSSPLFRLIDKGNGIDERLQRKQIVEIANQVFLISEPAAELVQELPALAQGKAQLLDQHCIPSDATLWQMQQFGAFLAARRERLAAAINTRLQSFNDALSKEKPASDIYELIKAGESASLEFKSTLRFNVRENVKDLELEQEVAKTIAAFLNGEGGYLLIGVEDSGNIFGIEQDMELVLPKNKDGFELALRALIRERLGAESNLYVRTYFRTATNRTICVVHVFRSPRPVFCTPKPPKQKGAQAPDSAITFFARLGNLSQSLNPAETNSYIAMHWRA